MKKAIKIMALLILVVVFAASQAQAFTLGGYNGPVSMKIAGFSQSGDTTFYASGETWAVFRLSRIEDNYTNPLWVEGQDNERIYGLIWGLTDANITGVDPLTINQVGGQFAMYIYSDGNATDEFKLDTPFVRRSAVDTYASITDGGTLFLDGYITPGIDPVNNYTINQIFSPSTGSGKGEGFADVNWASSAAYNSMFNNNMVIDNQGNGRDFNLDFDVSQRDAIPGWFAKIDDPIKSNVVPEPTSMLLFGTGLMGMIGAALRRKIG